MTTKPVAKPPESPPATVTLKALCEEMKIDPRIAREKLRIAVREPKKFPELAKAHKPRSVWEWRRAPKPRSRPEPPSQPELSQPSRGVMAIFVESAPGPAMRVAFWHPGPLEQISPSCPCAPSPRSGAVRCAAGRK